MEVLTDKFGDQTSTALYMRSDMGAAESTVYVIDDQELCRFTMQHILETANYSVSTFSTPTEFLSDLDSRQRGCIIVDYFMPTMSGIDLIKEVRSRGCAIPFIVVTGYGTIPLTVEFMKMERSLFWKSLTKDRLIEKRSMGNRARQP